MESMLLKNAGLVVAGFAVAVGLSVALVAWLVSRVLADVPKEDRSYKDEPPMGFKMLWYPVHWISHFLGPVIGGKRYQTLLLQLRKAGLEYTISPEQFVAARLVGALLCFLLFWWIFGSFDKADLGEEGFSLSNYFEVGAVGALLGYLYPALWLRDTLARRRSELLKSLPFYLDIITLCVEAGLNMQGAMIQSVEKGPRGVLRDEIQRVLRDIRAGKNRGDSLRAMSDRLNEPNVTSFTTAVIQAELMGMNLGPVLRAQADQRRTERFLRAEKLAMEAPVKMLFPLIAFIFPCTFIVLFFPIAMKFMHEGL
ncbi:type II secretion system F family protein [Massilia sp. Dwa41.01b]|uniref:type II secretion system F family protein n=1 Tax=unclassified Massilia TaxID=2609279 RepID=UPI0016026F72|nr:MULTISPECIES: type II secretion system F family protein [unclassified Massilia]QNA88724.1 type II secretion system F family protein [Massilia sp. Dwa41.01b]QNA99623.1 type II secretion system F family protein [Massilia sp. Se16.2.3]